MRENKGFTLIELLAVIVILAIIALIATPVILGIIEDARASANERSAELIKSGVQNAYTNYLMGHSGSYPAGINEFITDQYYTVDSTTRGDCGENTCDITTNDGVVTCTVTPEEGTIVVTCLTDDAFPPATSNNRSTRSYNFTAKLLSQ